MSATGRRRGNTNLPIRLGNLPKRRRMSLCMTPPSCMSEPATKPRLLELALALNKISPASYGGGLPASARRVIVEEKKWLDDDEFLSALNLRRVLPVANQMNFAVYFGSRCSGFEGAPAAV